MDGMIGLKVAASCALVFVAAIICSDDENKSKWEFFDKGVHFSALFSFIGFFVGAIMAIWGKW